MDFSAWILSIVGVAAITLIVDILLPEGETAKYIKSVFGILTVFIIAMPLPGILGGEVDFSAVFEESGAVSVDYEFVDQLNEMRIRNMETSIVEYLKKEGYYCDVSLEASFKDGSMIIDKVYVKTEKSVIVGNEANIDIIRKLVAQITGTDGGKIEVGYR